MKFDSQFLTHWLSRKLNVNKNGHSLGLERFVLAFGCIGHSGLTLAGLLFGGRGGLRLLVSLGIDIDAKTRPCFFFCLFFSPG